MAIFRDWPGGPNAQIREAFCRGAGATEMGQRHALFGEGSHHVARLGLRLTQVPSQADTRARVGVLPALQAGAWLAEAETPLAQHPGASRRKTGFLSCAQSHASPMALSDACDRDGRMARRQRGDERERRAIETLSCCLISQVTVLIK